jgi:hypothetical protein
LLVHADPFLADIVRFDIGVSASESDARADSDAESVTAGVRDAVAVGFAGAESDGESVADRIRFPGSDAHIGSDNDGGSDSDCDRQ